jgi:hypothetical protein|tara:strand:- start:1300 stop:1686 length:387 start_codon:yes stop_codon:yes gene_type:complete
MAIAANFLKQIRLTGLGDVGPQFSSNLVSATSTSGNITLPKAPNINIQGTPRIPTTPTSNLTYAPRQERASVTESFRGTALKERQKVSFADPIEEAAKIGEHLKTKHGSLFEEREAASGGFIKRKKVK